MRIKNLFKKTEKTMTLKVYFKSGNQVILDKVTQYEVTGDPGTGGIGGISLTYRTYAKERLLVQSLSLNAIDCITRIK